jgi:hypothetical protein
MLLIATLSDSDSDSDSDSPGCPMLESAKDLVPLSETSESTSRAFTHFVSGFAIFALLAPHFLRNLISDRAGVPNQRSKNCRASKAAMTWKSIQLMIQKGCVLRTQCFKTPTVAEAAPRL